MLNGSHSFLAYLGYLGGYETIADTMTNPDYRKAAFALMMQEQAPTLSMPEGTDLNAYATLLIERFSNPSLRHRTWQIAMDGSQKLPQRLLDPVRLHLQNGGSWRHLALGVAGWMRYTQAWMSRVMPLTWSTRCWPSSRRLTRSIRAQTA
ncbi:mannitol dehydrogenase domain-containing protein [Escherichia coli]|uniref:Mannitol dehydrogenase domain-containing protein n=1 Tax=Escherichia coli TaxID=562 RepID=A0A377DZE7_ECOLX|nr:mannitol dehydrogenase domain-containing protein [Escherichia coli]